MSDETERELVIVFPDREAKQQAMAGLGLPPHERNVASHVLNFVRADGAVRCEGCGTFGQPDEMYGTYDGVDLCPKCWAECLAQAEAEKADGA